MTLNFIWKISVLVIYVFVKNIRFQRSWGLILTSQLISGIFGDTKTF